MHPSRARTPLLEIRLLRPREAPRLDGAAAALAANAAVEAAGEGRLAAAALAPPAGSSGDRAGGLPGGGGPQPPPKRTRCGRVSDCDVPSVPEEWHVEEEAIGGSLLDQLVAAEGEARLAEGSAVRRAAGVLDGSTAGVCHIDVRLPPPAEDSDGDEAMCLVDPDEGF